MSISLKRHTSVKAKQDPIPDSDGEAEPENEIEAEEQKVMVAEVIKEEVKPIVSVMD